MAGPLRRMVCACRVKETTFVGATLKIRGTSDCGQSFDVDVGRKELAAWTPDPGDEIAVEWSGSALTVLRQSPRSEGVS